MTQTWYDDIMNRYFLKHSAAFDSPPFTYHMDAYKAIVKACGGQNVRDAYQYGWSNQPRVVTWSGNSEINKAIEKGLYAALPFSKGVGGLPSPIISLHGAPHG